MPKYVVTDLTRFSNRDIVCTAVVDVATGECLRPMPYFRYETVRKLEMTPGAIITGEIRRTGGGSPHHEDSSYQNLKYEGPASGAEFRQVLLQTEHACARSGFEFDFPAGQRFMPVGQFSPRSIITIRVEPSVVSVSPNPYEPEKIKLNVRDASGFEIRNMPITDLGFHEFARDHHAKGDLDLINRHLSSSNEIFVRIGLGRQYCQPATSNDGFWMQANGVYTFPSKLGLVRGYAE